MKKLFSFLFLLVFCAFLGMNCTRLVVIDTKDNGLKKGHTKNTNNPHHPNTTNPGHTKNKGNGKKN